MIDNMVTGNRLLVVTQTLPLYILTQMFFEDGNQINSGIIGTTKSIFELIKTQILEMKNDHANMKQPLLKFY